MLNKMFKALYYLFFALIAAVALLLLSTVLPVPGGLKVFIVQSGSMQPAIKTGSIVMVMPADDYHVGDVITFGAYSKTKAPTTHRIAEIKTEGGRTVYITQGDANNAADSRPVVKGDVIGKVSLTLPYVGYAVAAAKEPPGFIALILLPATIIIFDEVKKIWKEIKRLKSEKNEKTVSEN